MKGLEATADPLRLAVARHLATHPSASAPEVAAGVGVHLNTARAHLAALVRAGVAERTSESGGRRGRPTVRHRLVEEWMPEGEMLLPLSRLLAAAVRRLGAGPDELSDVARSWGRRWAGDSGSRPTEGSLAAAMTRLGFRATVSEGCLQLSGCPCPLVAPESPELVCGLADAVIDGVLEGTHLVAGDSSHDPDRRRCSTGLRNRTGR